MTSRHWSAGNFCRRPCGRKQSRARTVSQRAARVLWALHRSTEPVGGGRASRAAPCVEHCAAGASPVGPNVPRGRARAGDEHNALGEAVPLRRCRAAHVVSGCFEVARPLVLGAADVGIVKRDAVPAFGRGLVSPPAEQPARNARLRHTRLPDAGRGSSEWLLVFCL